MRAPQRDDWQIEQGQKCPCGGSDEYCPCQNISPEQKAEMTNADDLLDWMTHHYRPLSLFREEDGAWVVVDASTDCVIGSGGTCEEALVAAYGRPTGAEAAAAGGGFDPYNP